jgi:hypothetical protein
MLCTNTMDFVSSFSKPSTLSLDSADVEFIFQRRLKEHRAKMGEQVLHPPLAGDASARPLEMPPFMRRPN